MGEGARVECVPVDSATGAVLAPPTVAEDSWLRTLSPKEPRAYVSPKTAVNYEEDGRS